MKVKQQYQCLKQWLSLIYELLYIFSKTESDTHRDTAARERERREKINGY
jgi:hypothetical protein